MCDTINNSWGYNKNDGSYKSTKQIVQLLVKAAGYDANLLLNVGPRPDGTIQPEFVKRLARGRRLAEGRTARRSTARAAGRCRRGPGASRPRRANRVFVHVLDWKDAVLAAAAAAEGR